MQVAMKRPAESSFLLIPGIKTATDWDFAGYGVKFGFVFNTRCHGENTIQIHTVIWLVVAVFFYQCFSLCLHSATKLCKDSTVLPRRTHSCIRVGILGSHSETTKKSHVLRTVIYCCHMNGTPTLLVSRVRFEHSQPVMFYLTDKVLKAPAITVLCCRNQHIISIFVPSWNNMMTGDSSELVGITSTTNGDNGSRVHVVLSHVICY